MNWIIENAINKYNPRYVIALFSGGHDSLIATHIAMQHPQFSFALHINTGIGIEQTRKFVRNTCKDWGIELREYKAAEYMRADGKPDPQIYQEIVKQYGFPGAGQHSIMYARLKERPLRMALRDLERERNDKMLLITGVRSQESVRRMAHVKPVQIWEGTKIWIAPIWDYSKRDVNEYIEHHDLKRNEVVDLLHSSGECLCGAFAHKGELEEIRQWYPDMAQEIEELEAIAKQSGYPWRWEESPPSWWREVQEGQRFMPGFEMLCAGCPAARAG